MTDEEMLALMAYTREKYDPRQLDFALQLERKPVQDDRGQYLMFEERYGFQR